MGNLIKKMIDLIEERVDFSHLKNLISSKTVPQHKHTIWYYFGGITLFMFMVQVVTGIMLLLYYRPSPENAFESIKFIMTQVQFGWLIRSVHAWSANIMVLGVFLHMFSVFFLKAYRKPREMTWYSGMLLFFLSLAFGFSGYLLPWNELAYFATKVGTDIAGAVPVVGDFALRFMRGGDNVTGATLTRLFGFHVAVFPAIATVLLAVHLMLVQKQGMSVPLSIKKHKKMPFVPHFLIRDLLGWVCAVGVLVLLASFYPAELGLKADPYAAAPAGISPEWYFMYMFTTLKYIPSHIWIFEGEVVGVMAFSGAFLVAFFVPLLDKKAKIGESSKLFTIMGIVALAYIVIVTVISYTILK